MIGLGGSNTLGIGVLIQLNDNFTSTSQRVNSAMAKMQAQARAVMTDNLRDLERAGAVMMGIGGAITYGLHGATKAAASFEYTMAKVHALGGKNMKKGESKYLGQLAKDLSVQYGIMPEEVSGAILELIKRGVKGDEIPKALNAQILTAIGADERLSGEGGVAARMMDMAMAWGYSADDMAYIGDVMAKGTQMTSMGFLDLAESMKYSQDVLKSMNLSFEESVAMIGILSNAGIKASMAGTAMNNFYTQFGIALGGKSPKKNSVFAALGVSPGDFIKANGDMEDIIPTLSKLKEAMQPFGGVAKQQMFNDLFGIRGKRAFNPLIDALEDEVTKTGEVDKQTGKSVSQDGITGKKRLGVSLDGLLKDLKNSGGTNQKIADELMEQSKKKAEQFQAAWAVFKIDVGTALLPMLIGITKALTPILSLLSSFAQTSVGKVIIAILASGAMVALLFGGFAWAIAKIGLGFMGWKSTLDGIKMTMGWVMGGMKGNFVSPIAGQNINSAGSIYDKNGMLINNVSQQQRRQARNARGGGNGGGGGGYFGGSLGGGGGKGAGGRAARRAAQFGKTGASKVPLTFFGKMAAKGGVVGKIFGGIIKWGGKIVGGIMKVAPFIGKVLGFFGRFLPIVGWLWTAYSIYSALWGSKPEEEALPDGPEGSGTEPVMEKMNAEMDRRHRGQTSAVIPQPRNNYWNGQTTGYRLEQPKVAVNMSPQTINLYTDGELAYSKKLEIALNASVASEGFNV
jgi:TP901 family phage tail tape measure protein